MRRIATLLRVKANNALDRAEDPREALDYSYEQQLELMQKVRCGVADVATSRKRVQLQVAQMQLLAGKLQAQAQEALAAGREDLAREALIRRAAVTSQISDLQGQQASLQAEEDKLTLASPRSGWRRRWMRSDFPRWLEVLARSYVRSQQAGQHQSLACGAARPRSRSAIAGRAEGGVIMQQGGLRGREETAPGRAGRCPQTGGCMLVPAEERGQLPSGAPVRRARSLAAEPAGDPRRSSCLRPRWLRSDSCAEGGCRHRRSRLASREEGGWLRSASG